MAVNGNHSEQALLDGSTTVQPSENVSVNKDERDCQATQVLIEATPDCQLKENAEKKQGKSRWSGICRAIMKGVILVALLYLFICSLDFLSSAFRLLGGKTAGSVFTSNKLLANPITGLMIGILSTVLVQSSSTSTSVVVTMVASGILEVSTAIPIVMGANIGTSITNTLVSMSHCADKEQFRRAFAGATVHDMFNLASVLILLPLEVGSGYLYQLTELILNNFDFKSSSVGDTEFLKAVTKPFTKYIIQLDKKVLEAIALGKSEYLDHSLIKTCTDKTRKDTAQDDDSTTVATTEDSVTDAGLQSSTAGYTQLDMSTAQSVAEVPHLEHCSSWSMLGSLGLSDTTTGIILLVISMVMLCVCLFLMVKVLRSILQGKIADIIKKYMNSNLPGCLGYFTGYLAIIVGAVMTLLVQSSSVFTSALTPLVGLGVLELERVYPLTLGSNVGTTGTGLLAAFTASGGRLRPALQISLCHLFFNVSGILLFYPIPRTRIPIKLARMMGDTTAEYRWFPVFYLILLFVVFPAIVFSLACAGTLAVTIAACIVLAMTALIVLVNLLQKYAPKSLPLCMRTWGFLPEPLRSLAPMDRALMWAIRMIKRTAQCQCCYPAQSIELNPQDAEESAKAVKTVDDSGELVAVKVVDCNGQLSIDNQKL